MAFFAMLLLGIGTALVIVLLMPFAGVQESVLMVVMSLAMLFMLARAWTQARARRFAEHREWMIRLFGLSFFIALQRLYGTPMFLLTDWPQREAFMTSTVLAVVTAAVTAECDRVTDLQTLLDNPGFPYMHRLRKTACCVILCGISLPATVLAEEPAA
eukprot:gene17422-22221_t